MSENLQKLLHESLDRQLSPDEQAALEKGLAENPELLEEHDHLMALKTMAIGFQADFSNGFTDRLMQKIAIEDSRYRLQLFSDALWRSFRRIGFAAAVLLVGFVAYNLSSGESQSLTTALAIPQATMDQLMIPDVLMELE